MNDAASRRVLVVDDDASIRGLCQEVLSVAGYSVNTAANGLDALEMLSCGDYDLVVSDINMPELGGIDLYVRSVKRFPHLKGRFIFISGDIYGDTESELRQLDIRFMHKPFRIAEFMKNIDGIIAESVLGKRAKAGGKRQDGRFDLAASCEVSANGSARSLSARTENVSLNGLKVRYGGEPLKPGSRVELAISLNGLCLKRRAVTVWTAPDGAEGGLAGIALDEPLPASAIVNAMPEKAAALEAQENGGAGKTHAQ